MFRKIIEEVVFLLDEAKITRRIGYFFTLWVTYFSVTECLEFAETASLNGASFDIAAIIAAIMVPVSGLQAAALKFHNTGSDK